MPLDFTLTPAQRDLQRKAREFANAELSKVPALTAGLPDSEARFLATRPVYETVVREGFLKRLIPQPLGGEGTGLIDIAVLTEEFYAVESNVTVTLLANLLGLMPLQLAGTGKARICSALSAAPTPPRRLRKGSPSSPCRARSPASKSSISSTAWATAPTCCRSSG